MHILLTGSTKTASVQQVKQVFSVLRRINYLE